MSADATLTKYLIGLRRCHEPIHPAVQICCASVPFHLLLAKKILCRHSFIHFHTPTPGSRGSGSFTFCTDKREETLGLAYQLVIKHSLTQTLSDDARSESAGQTCLVNTVRSSNYLLLLLITLHPSHVERRHLHFSSPPPQTAHQTVNHPACSRDVEEKKKKSMSAFSVLSLLLVLLSIITFCTLVCQK